MKLSFHKNEKGKDRTEGDRLQYSLIIVVLFQYKETKQDVSLYYTSELQTVDAGNFTLGILLYIRDSGGMFPEQILDIFKCLSPNFLLGTYYLWVEK